MANIRCPMCSKVNAPDAQVCSFCGARLKPLGPDESAPQAPANSADDEPEWLRDLRGGEATGPSTGEVAPGGAGASGAAEPNQDADLPDWLSRIRGRAQGESSGSPEDSGQDQSAAGDELPGWMDASAADAQGPASDQPADLDNDWLARLQDTGEVTGATPAQETSDFSFSSDEASLDWLNQIPDGEPADSLQPADNTLPPATIFNDSGASAEAPAADDWMSAFTDWNPDAAQENKQPAQATDAGAAAGDLVDTGTSTEGMSGFGLTGFLDNLEGEEKPQEPPPAVETGEGFGLTGFFSSLEGTSEQPQAENEPDADAWNLPTAGQDETLPDWLQGAEPVTPVSSEPAVPMGTTGDLSSWLSSLEGEQTPVEPPAQPEHSADALPGWLSAAAGETMEASGQPAQPTQPEQALPGWLSETTAEDSGVPAGAVPSETANLGEGLTDWFSAFEQEGTAQDAIAAADAAEIPGAPDWLADAGTVIGQESVAGYTAAEETAVPADFTAFTTQEPAASMPAPFIDENAPDWLRDFASEGETSAEVTGTSPLLESEAHPQMQSEADQPFVVDLPDWIEEEAAQPASMEGAAETGVPADELERAELPSWVAAMRPVESVVPGDSAQQDADQYLEKAGPLSGMRGVLPIAENLIRYRKPPIYSVKLHTTEKQRNQAALLDTIIANESQPLLVPRARSRAPHLILRLLLALILVAVLALPNLMQVLGIPFDALSQPALHPAELEDMYNQINQGAQPGEEYTVLLAFDYEPGYSGEMRAAASPVVRHLMQQNARIVVVSTSPSGPALADQLLREAQSPGALSYSLENRVVNLGYLPGGTISLLELVRQPQLAAPANVNGEQAWQDTFLSGVGSFQDFSQVIVLTDSAETGRAWVEQVSPLMGDMPLFMVASAQAAPLLAPYLNVEGVEDSGQIDGMVAGMLGGTQYGLLAGQSNNPASRYWTSYQIGIVLAIVLVLAGGLISGFRRMLARDGKGEA